MITLKELKETFNQHLSNPPQVKPSHLEIFGRLTQPSALSHVLKEIIDTPQVLSEIASRSHRHTLGFHKIVLVRQNADGENINPMRDWEFRLHIWTPEAKDLSDTYHMEEIHAHNFDFLSRIVTGEITNECFAAMPAESPQEGMFDFFKDGTPQQKYSHTATLKTLQTVEAKAGDIYYHPHQTPHRVCQSLEQHNSTAILLTTTHPFVAGGSFRPSKTKENFEFTYTMYTPEELRDILLAYKNKLESLHDIEEPKFTEVLTP